MHALFAYGTLMFDEILRDVTGLTRSGAPVVLHGYRRRCVQGEPYPGIVSAREASVAGLLYRGISSAAWERLDRFEGEMYERRGVSVELESGARIPAKTYVVRPPFMDRLGPEDWDPQAFLQDGRHHFQRGYAGYHRLRGTGTEDPR